MGITQDYHEALGPEEGEPELPVPVAFTFSKCKDTLNCTYCRGWFDSQTRGRIYCDCECHSDAAVAAYEARLEGYHR